MSAAPSLARNSSQDPKLDYGNKHGQILRQGNRENGHGIAETDMSK